MLFQGMKELKEFCIPFSSLKLKEDYLKMFEILRSDAELVALKVGTVEMSKR